MDNDVNRQFLSIFASWRLFESRSLEKLKISWLDCVGPSSKN